MHVPYNALLIRRLLLGYQARLLYWGWKNVLNSTSCKYLLLAEFDVRTVSYGPSLFCSIYGSSGSSAKNEDTWFTVRASRVRCLLAELLCGQRPQEWSPIPILRGMLAIFYGHWQAEWLAGASARTSHFMTFLHVSIFVQLLANGVRGIAYVFWRVLHKRLA